MVYSADVSKSPAAGGDSWIKSWTAEAVSFNLLDWDTDGNKEIIVTLDYYREGDGESGGSDDVRVIILDQSDGTVEADTRYRVVNEN